MKIFLISTLLIIASIIILVSIRSSSSLSVSPVTFSPTPQINQYTPPPSSQPIKFDFDIYPAPNIKYEWIEAKVNKVLAKEAIIKRDYQTGSIQTIALPGKEWILDTKKSIYLDKFRFPYLDEKDGWNLNYIIIDGYEYAPQNADAPFGFIRGHIRANGNTIQVYTFSTLPSKNEENNEVRIFISEPVDVTTL